MYVASSRTFLERSLEHYVQFQRFSDVVLQGVTGEELVIASARKDREVSAESEF